MFSEPKLGAIAFFVSNLTRSEAFYRDVLGLPVQRMGEANEQMLIAELGPISLIFFEGEETRGRSPIPVFNVGADNIEQIVAKLTSRGVEIVAPLQHAPDGGMTADFLDPDGHVLSVYQQPAHG
jgi:predicted enzyme related to lactoylglutathione lyase